MNKETQKQLLTEVMNADAKDGFYDHFPDASKMVTAVEWLEDKLKQNLKHIVQNADSVMMESLFLQAKQMEKEQIVIAHYQGYRNFIDTTEISEQYYNETYGK